MKNSVLVGMALGLVVGAVGVSLYKPAQNVVRKSAEAIKEEAQTMIAKAKK